MRFTRARVSSSMRTEARSESFTIGAGYFWFYAGVGTFIPFNALYYRHLGFSGLELGVLTSLPAIATALLGPVWGIVADTFGLHRQIMRVVLLLAAGIVWLLTDITTFVPFMVVIALLSVVLVPIPSLWDSYAVSAVERGGAPYGVLRIFGSIGFTVMVLIMGRIMADGLSTIFLYAYAACFLVTFLVSLRLPALGERQPRRLLDGLQGVAKSAPYRLLLLVAFLISMGYTTLNIYLTLHIESLGGDTGIAGIAFATSALSELPVIGLGAVILKHLGARRVIFIALGVYIIRFALLGFTFNTSFVLLAQVMHGLSFGMFLIASVTLAHRLVGRENAATAQALLAMVSVGLGSISGSFLGGLAIDITTTSVMFRVVTFTMALTMVIFWIGSRRLEKTAYDPPLMHA